MEIIPLPPSGLHEDASPFAWDIDPSLNAGRLLKQFLLGHDARSWIRRAIRAKLLCEHWHRRHHSQNCQRKDNRANVSKIRPHNHSPVLRRRRSLSSATDSYSDSDALMISGGPTPRAGTVPALHHALLVDFGDDRAVAGEQRLGRAHLGANRPLALGEPVAA